MVFLFQIKIAKKAERDNRANIANIPKYRFLSLFSDIFISFIISPLKIKKQEAVQNGTNNLEKNENRL